MSNIRTSPNPEDQKIQRQEQDPVQPILLPQIQHSTWNQQHQYQQNPFQQHLFQQHSQILSTPVNSHQFWSTPLQPFPSSNTYLYPSHLGAPVPVPGPAPVLYDKLLSYSSQQPSSHKFNRSQESNGFTQQQFLPTHILTQNSIPTQINQNHQNVQLNHPSVLFQHNNTINHPLNNERDENHHLKSDNIPKNPLPPYALATMNNTSFKRQKLTEPKQAKKGLRSSRRRHRNSHLGCGTCKSRRIKCDEQLPGCKNCVRARLKCAYLSLDNAAKEALKAAQQAHAARLESLDNQLNFQENKSQLFCPFKIEGLPTKIFSSAPIPPFPPSNIQAIQINLRTGYLPFVGLQQNSVINPLQPMNNSTNMSLKDSQVISKNPKTKSRKKSSPKDETNSAKSNSVPSLEIPPEENTKVKAYGDEYRDMVSLIHGDRDSYRNIDDLAKVDGQYVEFVLDPECLRHLNKFWTEFDKTLLEPFSTGFEKEILYKAYEKYHNDQMKEASNNIILLKSMLLHGAMTIFQTTKDSEAKSIAEKYGKRDFEICLRFLNKIQIKFLSEINDIYEFAQSVSLCYSKFQILQTLVPSTIYYCHTLKDNVQVTNKFFEFIINYLNGPHKLFLDEKIYTKYNDDPNYKRSSLFNDFMSVYIDYYVQCIKSYHTTPYKTTFVSEFIKNFVSTKDIIYDKLSDEDKVEYDNLETFLIAKNQYWTFLDSKSNKTNRIQVIFYTLKKFLEILSPKTYIHNTKRSFEACVLETYYNATVNILKAIYPEVRFYFIFSFNGRDGTVTSNSAELILEQDSLTEKQKEILQYPLRISNFFKERTLLISKILSQVPKFPAKIIFDDSNKKTLSNLINEKQVTSFQSEVPKTAYPFVDETSNFYNKETQSIVIPSVSPISESDNFSASQFNRAANLQEAITGDLFNNDEVLFKSLFKSEDVSNKQKNQKDGGLETTKII